MCIRPNTNFFLCVFFKIKFMLWVLMSTEVWSRIWDVWGVVFNCRVDSLQYFEEIYCLCTQRLSVDPWQWIHSSHPKRTEFLQFVWPTGSIIVHEHHDFTHEIQYRCALRSFILMCSPIFHITNLVAVFNFFISSYTSLQNDNA
jgi:hypothetical protein